MDIKMSSAEMRQDRLEADLEKLRREHDQMRLEFNRLQSDVMGLGSILASRCEPGDPAMVILSSYIPIPVEG